MHNSSITDSHEEKPKKTQLLRSGLLVSSMTMLSRILGLIRDMVLAAVLGGVGSGGLAGPFFIAFKVPNFLRRLFAEGAFSQAFVPVLSEYQQKKPVDEVKAFIQRVCGGLAIIVLLVVALVFFGAHWVTYIVAPGFLDDIEKLLLTEKLLRITFPYLLLVSMAGFFGAILNTYNRFAIPAFTPIWLNVCLIVGALWGLRWTDNIAVALAYSVLIAGVIQCGFLLPFVYRIGMLTMPKIDFKHPGVKRILWLMLPAILGVSVSQINLLFDTMLASLLPEGSIAWLYFSQRISDLPLGVFAIAISTVILPALSRQFSTHNTDSFGPTINWAVRLVCAIAIPSTCALIVLAEPILISLFQYGKFTATDVTMSAWSLITYSLGLMFFMLIKVLVPGYYARQDMKTPVTIAIWAMLINMLLNIVFVIPMHYYWQLGHAGLALATSCGAIFNVVLLYRGLRKAGIYQIDRATFLFVAKIFAAAALMVIVLFYFSQNIHAWVDKTAYWRVFYLLALCLVGAVIYMISLLAFGLRVRHFKHAL